MNDSTDLNWLHPGVRVRSLVDRNTLEETIDGVRSPSHDLAHIRKGDIRTVMTVEEHPFVPGWFGIEFFEGPFDVLSSLRDPMGDSEDDLRRKGVASYPLLWEPVDD